MGYDHKKIETKWQKYWDEHETFKCDVYDFSKPKYYILDMFPYPSGEGLHVGHFENYTATDIMARMQRMRGYNVLHPIGWDAFGLPAEQYAIKTNHHPEQFTRTNIERFKKQLRRAGFSYDWSKEIATIDEGYIKWTQWIFLKLYEDGLAYVSYQPVNFCPALGTVLANEEVIDGKSEVGGFPVIRKPMRQWMLKITAYADKLEEGLSTLDWPHSTLEMQKNWIGRSFGTRVVFDVKGKDVSFNVFTTRVDTLYGCMYCCLAPEHPLVAKITSEDKKDEVEAYLKKIASKSDLERTDLNKEKTGVFIGAHAINPINGEEVPIYIADYVLANYGEGAVMAVPAHDERDYAFAKAHGIGMRQVLEGDISKEAFTGDAKHINSPLINGLNIDESKKVLNDYLKKIGKGEEKITYKLRDWLFSRQRYWGEPIPVVYLDDNTIVPLNESDLPLTLPHLDEYKPSGTGESPLALAKDWLDVTIDGKHARRETNTMPQWAGSCWYYIRYLDPHNDKCIADPKLIEHWLPVDLYVGGAEHAVLHLLYARFWHKVLFDHDIVKCEEPFKKLFHQGMILGSNYEKMSKSRGNIVNPDDLIEQFGADALRFFEMFMGPLEASLPWNDNGVEAARKYLDRVYRLIELPENAIKISDTNDHSLDYVYHYTVKKVTEDFLNLQYNTGLAQLMVLTNEMYKATTIYKPYLVGLIIMLSPVSPHLMEEMYEMLGYDGSLSTAKWPTYNDECLKKNDVTIGVQINGKLRGTITIDVKADEKAIEEAALALPSVQKYIEGHEIKKIIVIKHRIVSIVIN